MTDLHTVTSQPHTAAAVVLQGSTLLARAAPDAPSAEAAAVRQGLPAACLNALLDELDSGIVVCDANGHTLLVNEAARREIAEGGVLHLAPGGMLDVASGPGQLALRRAVHGAAWERRYQLLPLRVGGRVLLVSVQPLRAATVQQPCALLLLGRRALCGDLAVQRLATLYALTDAEQAVLTHLLAGTRVDDLARQRGVALSTIRTQVAALRAKFGVRRVDEITRLAAELPPMMSALRSQMPQA